MRGPVSTKPNKLDRLDASWWARHRRLWIFLILAPYLVMAPMLLLMPLGRKVPDAVILTVGVVCLVALLGYATVGLVWLHRVYSAGRIKMRSED